MAFMFRGCSISKIGVIGSGQIGPDIALHFVKVLHPYDVQVVVVDVAEALWKKERQNSSRKWIKEARKARSNPTKSRA